MASVIYPPVVQPSIRSGASITASHVVHCQVRWPPRCDPLQGRWPTRTRRARRFARRICPLSAHSYTYLGDLVRCVLPGSGPFNHLIWGAKSVRVRLGAPAVWLFAPDPVAVAIETVDVLSDDGHRALHVGRTVTATAGAVDVARHRHAGAGVVGVAWGVLLLGYLRPVQEPPDRCRVGIRVCSRREGEGRGKLNYRNGQFPHGRMLARHRPG